VSLLSTNIWADEQALQTTGNTENTESADSAAITSEETAQPAEAIFIDESPAYPELTATYRAEWKGGWFPIGIEAQRTLRHHSDGTSSFIFGADATIGALEEKSVVRWHNGQVRPQKYSYKVTGLFNEPDRSQDFDWKKEQIINAENDRPYTDQWHQDIQDNLSYHLQASIDLKNGKKLFEYPVFDRKKVKMFRFRVVGRETLKTRMGRLNAVKVEQIESKKSKKKTFIWFAEDYDYILLRLWQKDKKDKVYQIDLIEAEIGGRQVKK